MKICIYGAGAIGGYLAAELALVGEDITVIARGPHLEAMRRDGLTLLIGDERKVAKVACTDDPAEAGPQDCVIITLKAHSVTAIVDKMAPLLGDETSVVTAQNGVPWWYFYKLPGDWENRRLETADPGGRIWDTLGPERAIGCVVYPSCEIVEPGVIQHVYGNRFMLGEPDGSKSPRVVELSRALVEAGLKAPVRTKIRDDIWLKLWGNVSFNPVSVLTLATLEQMCEDEGSRGVVATIMTEAEAVGKAVGVKFKIDVETRIGWAADVGAHKTSMLQDLEQGRPMETDALVGTVAEMGRMVGVATPTMMAEAEAVGKAVGVKFKIDVETRIGWAADVGAHKTSMLQDLEQGRPMETDALVGTVAEMGRMVGVATPTIDAILALVRLRARM